MAIMLSKDVTNLAEESSDAIRDLLVMQQVQVIIVTSVLLNFVFLILDIFLCFLFVEP